MIEPVPDGTRVHRPASFVVATLLAALLIALLATPMANAQGVRSLGMGGTSTPASNGSGNPAFGALPDAGTPFFLPLPLGAVNVLLRPELDPRSDQFDLLSAFDQASHLGTLLLNPARSPDEVIVSVANDNGVPAVAIDFVGGSPLQISHGTPVGYGQAFELPIGFDVGPVGLGIRPYIDADGRLTPLAGFGELFNEGTSSGEIAGRLQGEAGVGVNVTYATALPIPASEAFAGQVFLGVRAEPFIGLARIDGTGTFTVTTTENDDGETEFGYDYEGDGFYALVGQGGLGYGVTGDLGVAVTLPTPDGRLTAGLGVTDLGIGLWQGMEVTVAGDSLGASSQTGPTPSSRTYLFDRFGVNANVAYEFDTAVLGVPDLGSLLVAADGAYDDGAISGHLGVEGGYDFEIVQLLLRAGGGFDDGLTAGVGAGVRVVGIGFDVAVHTYRSPFTAHQAVGAAVGLGFGF
ncbi:MAG: hypothetical protein WD314_03100 [Trueperaceae bacterium]